MTRDDKIRALYWIRIALLIIAGGLILSLLLARPDSTIGRVWFNDDPWATEVKGKYLNP